MVVGMLGSLPFVCSDSVVFTPVGVERGASERYARHDVIGGRPVIEWVGTDADEVSLTIRLDSSLGVAPELGVKLIGMMAESHEAQPLIIGPSYMGTFVVTGISEDRRHSTGAGVCIVDEVRLQLVQVGKGWV